MSEINKIKTKLIQIGCKLNVFSDSLFAQFLPHVWRRFYLVPLARRANIFLAVGKRRTKVFPFPHTA
jgi:hypothetical protein